MTRRILIDWSEEDELEIKSSQPGCSWRIRKGYVGDLCISHVEDGVTAIGEAGPERQFLIAPLGASAVNLLPMARVKLLGDPYAPSV